MSIATKTGDKGTTALLFGTRVSKADSRIAVVGEIDELCASIGLIKPAITRFVLRQYYPAVLSGIQTALTLFMGEVASEPDKRKSYAEKYSSLTEAHLEILDREIANLEKDPNTKQSGWVVYGDSEIGARCDFASKVCRRAERAFSASLEEEQRKDSETSYRPVLAQYINRLSDFLHLLARYFDSVSKDTIKQSPKYRYE